MIPFSRSILVGVERHGEHGIRLNGVLEDNLYAVEVNMEISRPEHMITAISGRMKRYTTPECPKATAVLQEAVGMRVDEPGIASRINKVIGRRGCRHYAELILECIDTFIAAEPVLV